MNVYTIYYDGKEVCNDIPSDSIKLGFIISHQNAAKVIKYRGKNKLHRNGNLGSDIKTDFINTDKICP